MQNIVIKAKKSSRHSGYDYTIISNNPALNGQRLYDEARVLRAVENAIGIFFKTASDDIRRERGLGYKTEFRCNATQVELAEVLTILKTEKSHQRQAAVGGRLLNETLLYVGKEYVGSTFEPAADFADGIDELNKEALMADIIAQKCATSGHNPFAELQTLSDMIYAKVGKTLGVHAFNAKIEVSKDDICYYLDLS